MKTRHARLIREGLILAGSTPDVFYVPRISGLRKKAFLRRLEKLTTRAIERARNRALNRMLQEAYYSRAGLSVEADELLTADHPGPTPATARHHVSVVPVADDPDDFFRAQARAE